MFVYDLYVYVLYIDTLIAEFYSTECIRILPYILSR